MNNVRLFSRLFSGLEEPDIEQARECHLVESYLEDTTKRTYGVHRGFRKPLDEYTNPSYDGDDA